MTQLSELPSQTALEEVVTASLGSLAGTVRVSLQGSKVMLRGMVPSYADKARLESLLRAAGFSEVDNGVRVMPTMTSIS